MQTPIPHFISVLLLLALVEKGCEQFIGNRDYAVVGVAPMKVG